jgi:hypothetical protein
MLCPTPTAVGMSKMMERVVAVNSHSNRLNRAEFAEDSSE